jgi:peptidoglycan/xylan/chitin deacetylase (PgdA/CDA1 family)
MSADQLRALKKAGMSVQSHAKSHRFLDELGPDDVLMEMKASKQALEGLLG